MDLRKPCQMDQRHYLLKEDLCKMGLLNRTGMSCTVSCEMMMDDADIYEDYKYDIAFVIAYSGGSS